MEMSARDQERFKKYYIAASGCWSWTGGVDGKGYGKFKWKGRSLVASRAAYTIAYGRIPDGLCVCHRCDNPKCVRPSHLFLGTKADNQRDMAAKGRSTYGAKNPAARLSPEDVREIRRLAGDYTHAQLAQRFGVSAGHIWKIVRRKKWACIA